MKPKFKDAKRFRLPYADSAETQKEGYLSARFAQYRELLAKEQANVKQIRSTRKVA